MKQTFESEWVSINLTSSGIMLKSSNFDWQYALFWHKSAINSAVEATTSESEQASNGRSWLKPPILKKSEETNHYCNIQNSNIIRRLNNEIWISRLLRLFQELLKI